MKRADAALEPGFPYHGSVKLAAAECVCVSGEHSSHRFAGGLRQHSQMLFRRITKLPQVQKLSTRKESYPNSFTSAGKAERRLIELTLFTCCAMAVTRQLNSNSELRTGARNNAG
jgi:hypothetical protein